MATEKQDIDSQQRWKARYYEALGELEHKERYWRDAERQLRHLVNRLTLAADTRHEQLNQNLRELRSAIRDGRDVSKFSALIETISTQVAQLDSMRKASQSRPHPAHLLVEVLDKLELPAELSRTSKQFRKQIDKLRDDDSSDEALAQFVAILNQLPPSQPAEAPDKTRKQKLLERILLRQDKPEAGSDEETEVSEAGQSDGRQAPPQKFLAPAVGDLLLQMALRMPPAVKQRINFAALKKHTNRARTRKDLIPIIDVLTQHIDAAYKTTEPNRVLLDEDSVMAMAQAVTQFFTQLEPPLDLKDRITELEQYCNEHGSDVESLVYCLNSLAEVVAEICRRLVNQRVELESFFVALTDRLRDLDSGLKKTAALNAAGQDSTQQMDAAVHAEMQGIQTSIHASTDLAELKGAIAARLDAIDRHLQDFHTREQQRHGEAQQTIAELSDKVAVLENNGDELRKHLEASRQQAMRDVLTGIANRHAYEDRLAAEVARSKRYATPLSMVVWDIDNFKMINDNYGHAAGDRVIKVVAQMLADNIRETDFVARFGGEEFVLLMPQTELEAAGQVADKLRIDIQNTPFHFRDTGVTVTISAGIAQYQADETAASLFERADAALYKAKEAGRNQIKAA